jgi:hypothetical protein
VDARRRASVDGWPDGAPPVWARLRASDERVQALVLDGAARFRGLGVAQATLETEALPDGRFAWETALDLRAPSATVRLQTGRPVRGRAVSPTGTRLALVHVVGVARWTDAFDPEGRFLLDGVPEGAHLLEGWAYDGEEIRRRWTGRARARAGDVDVVLAVDVPAPD